MRKFYFFILVLFATTANAQNPTVVGDSMLCPNSTGMVSTQPYDTYQWFIRYFGSSTITPISGANSQFLPIDYSTYAASYLSVEVTLGANDYISPEFFVDGWVFSGFTVASTGDFTIGPFGESVLCPGDTMYFEVMQPYDTNITWYYNGDTIPGINSTILTVTTPGIYYVTGAPSLCPLYIEGPGVDLTVIDCPVGIDENGLTSSITVYPNPTSDMIRINGQGREINYILTDALGKIVKSGTSGSTETEIDLRSFVPGIYFLKSESGTVRVIKL
ncbi:MAG: T9SS type A sorting domain-containing protein [Bacteroidetes bacterium]|nr:T9SS type A sorting domain-containing protein [Bacteroidota bacterium]